MARLARKNIKVFAGSANNNGVFGSLQANNPTKSNDVETIQSLEAWEQGWNAATETSEDLPPLEEIQAVEYVTSYEQAYLMQEGLPEWASTVTYYKGSLTKEVTANGFKIYCSLTDENLNNAISDTSNWKKVMDSEDLYAFDSAVVKLTGDQIIAGNKTFSSSPIAPTPTSGDSSTKVATTEFVKDAIGDLSENAVKTYGNQTINGTKTFTTSPLVPTATNGDKTQKAASTEFVANSIVIALPAGTILPFGGSSAPTGFLLCDGTAISRTAYAALFAAIGTTYGAGDGSTTFNLPNGKIPLGVTAPCKGSGINLGITNGTSNYGLTVHRDYQTQEFCGYTGVYGGTVGTSYSSSTRGSITPQGLVGYGITTDETKSGIVVDLTKASSVCNAIIKY